MVKIGERSSGVDAQSQSEKPAEEKSATQTPIDRGDGMDAKGPATLPEAEDTVARFARFMRNQGFGGGKTQATLDARTAQKAFAYLTARPAVYAAFHNTLDPSQHASWPAPEQVIAGDANAFARAELTAPMLTVLMAIGDQADRSHVEEETFALARYFVESFGPESITEEGAEPTGRAVVNTIATLEAAANSPSLPAAHRTLAERNIEALRRKVTHELAGLVDGGNRDRAVAFLRGMAETGDAGVREAGAVAGRTLMAVGPKDGDADDLVRALADEKPSFWDTFLQVLAEIFSLGFAKTDWGDGDKRGKDSINLASDPRFVRAFAEQTNDAGISAAEVMRQAIDEGWTSAVDESSLAAFDASLAKLPQVQLTSPRAMLAQATEVASILDAHAITEHNAHHMGESVAQTIANLEWVLASPDVDPPEKQRADHLLATLREKSATAVANFARAANQDRAVMFLHGVAEAETSWSEEGRACREAGAIAGRALLSAGSDSASAGDLVDAMSGKERNFWDNFFDILVEIFTFSLAKTAWGDGDARGKRVTELMAREEFMAGLEGERNGAGTSGADVLHEAFGRGYRSRADRRVSTVLEEALERRRAAGDVGPGVAPPVTSPEEAAKRAFPGGGFGLFDAARPPIPVAEMGTLFPEQFGSMSYEERYAWERQVTDRLELVITASEPDQILSNLRTQYGDASPAEQLMVARHVASIMGGKNYDYDALNTDTPTNTTPQQMMEAMQEAVRTGNKVPEGICGDIHLATASVLNAMGIDAGIGAVQSHFISTMRLSDGTFAIIDYGTLYLGRSMAEVFTAYEERKGQLALWHLVTDAEGNYVGRVQTPVGKFLEQTLSPAQTFADYLQGKPLPEGVKVDMYNRRGQLEGNVEAAADIVGGLRASVRGGGTTVHGTELDFAVAGLGYRSEHFSIDVNVGRFEAKFPSDAGTQDYAGGDVRIGVRDTVGNLSYGASIGGSGMAQLDKQKGTGTSEAKVGAVYDVPLGSEDGSAYFGVQAIGLPSGFGPDGGTTQGALVAGARAITFHNRELELAAGVKLNLEQAQLHLGGRVTMSNLDRGQGVFVRYVSGRTTIDAGFDHFDQQAWQGRSGNQMRVTVGRDLGNGWSVQAGGRMRLEGDQLGELSLRKTGHIDWPFGDEVPDEARAAITEWGYDPDAILQPREGIMRGLQYQALIGLQAGVRMSPEEYAALGIRVDFAEGTLILPKWMHESAHINVAASGSITLRNFCQLELGPVFAMDAEFGGWSLGLLATWRRLRAAVAIGGKNRFVAGAQLGLGATGFASAFAGYQRFREDGTKTTVTVGTDFNVTIERGEITFGGFNHGTSMGLAGAESWTYRNPGMNVASATTGEVFAHKRALSTSGFMDLFQFVSKTRSQKAKIAIISSRLAAASEQGVGFFFSEKALGQLKSDDTLAQVAQWVQSPGFERMIKESGGTWEGDVGADAIVFDSFSGGSNSFDADKGDIHIGDIAFGEGAERPMVHNTDIKVLKPGRRALARAWRKRGLRLLDLDQLSAQQFRGLTNLLGYVDGNLEGGQMTNKQITFTAGGLRSLAESIGLLSGTKDTEAGATVALSPRILERLADAHLGPSAIELSPDLSETERLMAGRLTRHLDSAGLLVNGKSVVRFHSGSGFPGDADELFVARGDAILVNLGRVANAKTEEIEKEFKDAADDDDLLDALGHMRRERTQDQRLAGMARQAGRGKMAVYYPDAPPRTLEGGAVRHRYRAYDVYGDPLKDAQGRPLERAFEITLRDDASRTDVEVVWDNGRRETLTLTSPEDYLALKDSYPELRPLLEGMIGDEGHLPGLRLLHLLQLVESERAQRSRRRESAVR